jgi:hypothetical protein
MLNLWLLKLKFRLQILCTVYSYTGPFGVSYLDPFLFIKPLRMNMKDLKHILQNQLKVLPYFFALFQIKAINKWVRRL